MLAWYVVYELALSSIKPFLHTTQGYIFEQTIFYLVPYALVFSLGLRLPELGRNELFHVAATAFIIFAGFGFWQFTAYGKFVPTQEFKYPPQIYYLSYAVFVSVVAWIYSKTFVQITNEFRIISGVKFVAQNSIWVYLWHIPFIEIFAIPFYLKYPMVFAFATFLTAIQIRLVKQYLLPNLRSVSLKKNLSSLLTG